MAGRIHTAYEGDRLIIFDGDGNPRIQEGEEVYMGGGEGSKCGMLECVGQQPPDSCSGKFVLYTPSRCPRIHSKSGMTDYLPIWPLDYTMDFVDSKLVVMDETGQVVATEGDELTLSGGGICHSRELEEYR
jgi:hypothetical protein